MKNSSKQSVKMDMLHGSLFDKMLMFAMPLAACSILQQLFNSVGTAVVGRFASSEALAAVGSNSSVIALMVTLFSGISLGSNVVIANYIGQNDTKRIPRVVHTAVSLALLSGVFLLILGQFVHGSGFNWKDPDHFRVVYLPRVEVLDDASVKLRDFLEYYRQ